MLKLLKLKLALDSNANIVFRRAMSGGRGEDLPCPFLKIEEKFPNLAKKMP